MPGGKGKKLSKADKEKRKREEEERRRIEEEEERLRMEEEEKQRRKQEKIEAEERKKREKEELKVRSVELEDLRRILDGFHEQADDYHSERRRQTKWNRYLLCDGSPDPTIQPEINAYINCWREDDKRVLIEDVLTDSLQCLRLISELNGHFEDGTVDEKDSASYSETIRSLRKLLHEKLNRASYEMLRRAVYLADPETMNLEAYWKNEYCCLSLWGNLCKNPRIRSFDFSDVGISFEIPKALTKVGCAYRFLLTYYDHYSPLSRSYNAIEIPPPEPEIVQESQEDAAETKEEDVEIPVATEDEEAKVKENTDLMAELNKLDDGENPDEDMPREVVEVEEIIETPVEDLRASPIPKVFEDFDGEEDAIDLRSFQIVGPIMHFNILQLPTQPVEKNGWTIIQHSTPPDIQPFDYKPVDLPKASSDETETQPEDTSVTGTGSIKPESKKAVEIENPPIAVMYKLPKNVYYAEQPQIAIWDTKTQEWRTDGIEVSQFDEQSVVFKTTVFGTLGFFQDFHINMPFQSWELRPLDYCSCQLTIVASINEVVIHVKDDQVCVYEPPIDETDESTAVEGEGKSALRFLSGKWMSVRNLAVSLREAGINLFPREDSSKNVSIPDKSVVAESMLYSQMSLMSTAMAFSWSRWNSECSDRERIIVQACEHLATEPINEDAWSVYSFTRKKVERLKMQEFEESFNDEVDTSVGFHADFYHVFAEIGSEEGKQRTEKVDFHYHETVNELLNACRPLVFS